MGRRKNDQSYFLPKEIYFETIWYIRSYPQMLEKAQDILDASRSGDDAPGGGGIGDPTARKADKYAEVMEQIRPITKALKEIPEEYQQPIFNHIVFRVPLPGTANIKTFRKWRKRYIYWVALIRGRAWQEKGQK